MKAKSPSRNFLIPIKKPYKFGYGRKKSYLCTDLGYKSCIRFMVRRDGRVVDYSSLENCRTERYRGFESLSLRKQGCKSTSYVICTLYYTPKSFSVFLVWFIVARCQGFYSYVSFRATRIRLSSTTTLLPWS